MAADVPRPWVTIRLELETPAGTAVSFGTIQLQQMKEGQPFVLQIPIYGESHLSDGWPARAAEFGDAVKARRTLRAWTQTTLARLAKISDMTVRNIEKAEVSVSPDVRARLIEVLSRDVPQDPTTPKKDSPSENSKK